jgi:hypothetical protein
LTKREGTNVVWESPRKDVVLWTEIILYWFCRTASPTADADVVCWLHGKFESEVLYPGEIKDEVHF